MKTGDRNGPRTPANRRVEIEQDERWRENERARSGRGLRQLGCFGAVMLAFGVVAVIATVTQPGFNEKTAPAWPFCVAGLGILLFLVGRSAQKR